jgi:hypothetical protein
MSDAYFFQKLPAIRQLSEITNPTIYHDIPADWHIALTDVRGSTKAIAAGRYKEVNGVSAATITALLNSLPKVDIPFVFGGDGATILIPPEVVPLAKKALIASQRLAKEHFQLDLRIGIVPVQAVLAGGYAIRVTKLFMSDNFQQAIFTGGGLGYAEKLLKDPEQGLAYAVEDFGGEVEGDFTGFECRWDEMPGPHGETVSLMVQAVGSDVTHQNAIYREVIEKIEEIYGDSSRRHPIALKTMRVAKNPNQFKLETAVRQNTTSFGARLYLMLYAIAGYFIWKYRTGIWDQYKDVVRAATDHEKFDDTLRMIISGTPRQRDDLQQYLDTKRKASEAVYGIHVSNRALMTCLVFDRFGRQVHFVDGADGGYALAAKEMKAQIAQLATMERATVKIVD